MTKKDPGLVFHFHVINLFKCWSKLGFNQNSNEHNKFKKNEKHAHIVYICHILMITVHKQVTITLELKIHVSNVISQTLSYKVKVEEKWFWILNMKFSKTSPMLHFEAAKKDPGLVLHFHVSNLFKSWSKLGLTKIQIEHRKFKKMENMRT